MQVDGTNKKHNQVMIVDDDPDILDSVNMLLTKEGLDVITCSNGWGCLLELEKGFEGVILMDINMPGINGWSTIKNAAMGGFLENNRVIILTAKKIPDKEMDEFEGYIDGYIIKPFDINLLIETVKKSLK